MLISQELFTDLLKLDKEEFNLKFNFLGEGISRKVYALNENYVIKVAKDKEGIYQNKVENYVYTHVSIELIKYLAPIACFNPRILIMKRAIPLSNEHKENFINIFKFNKDTNFFKDLCCLADKYYLFYEDLITTSSWGQIKGKYVLIDYGCTSPFGDMFYDIEFHMNSFNHQSKEKLQLV